MQPHRYRVVLKVVVLALLSSSALCATGWFTARILSAAPQALAAKDHPCCHQRGIHNSLFTTNTNCIQLYAVPAKQQEPVGSSAFQTAPKVLHLA
jgi:hypothetical protein